MMIQFWLTTACNMKCKYCYEGIDKENKFMNFNIADKAIDFMMYKFNNLETNELVISLHGGEPLLNFEVLKHICIKTKEIFKSKKIQPRFWITSNLYNVNDEMIDFLAEHMDKISVSIDGDEKSHNLNRILKNNQGTYNMVLKNSINLINKRNDVRARMTVNIDNFKNLFNNVKHLYEIGFREIMPALDYYDQRWDEENLEILYNETKKLAEFLADKENKNSNLNIGLVKNIKMKRKNSLCTGGFTSISIDPDGYLYPCTQTVNFKDFIIGSIYNGIDKIKLEEIHKNSNKKNEDCIGCTRYNYCIGTRCKFINKVFNGEYTIPSPLLCAEQNLLINTNLYYESLKKC